MTSMWASAVNHAGGTVQTIGFAALGDWTKLLLDGAKLIPALDEAAWSSPYTVVGATQ
jgi:hypothetical protein